MKKNKSSGFMLAETLVVTIFVAGVLIFLFMQFSKLNNSYNEYYIYNTTESLFALDDVKKYIISDNKAYNYIEDNIPQSKFIDITNCDITIFTNNNYCNKLLELEKVKKIYVLDNTISYKDLDISNDEIKKFINKIDNEGTEIYRLVALFDGGEIATIRFGQEKES